MRKTLFASLLLLTSIHAHGHSGPAVPDLPDGIDSLWVTRRPVPVVRFTDGRQSWRVSGEPYLWLERPTADWQQPKPRGGHKRP